MAHTELSSSNKVVPNLLATVGHMSCTTLWDIGVLSYPFALETQPRHGLAP